MRTNFRSVLVGLFQFSPWIFCFVYGVFTSLTNSQYLTILPVSVATALAFLIAFLCSGFFKSRVLLALWALLLLLPILAQIQSLRLSGELISVMALANADAAKAISLKIGHVAPFFMLAVSICLVLLFPVKHHPRVSKYALIPVLAAYTGLVIQNSQSRALINPFDLPLISLISTVLAAEYTTDGIYVSGEERARLEQEFRRSETYQPNNRYEEALRSLPKHPNIVVLFIEGGSARFMSAYGGNRPTLMPNLDSFYRKSLVVDNYFNHTAATLRGLRGQLTSSFIGARENGEDGLASVDSGELIDHARRGTVLSVPDILHDNGYSTAFLTPHLREMNINTIIKDVGFDQVVTGSDVASAAGIEHIPISDKYLYKFLPNVLEKFEEPYFVGVYNFGTHLLEDSPDERFENGSSPVLNRLHNVDAQIGKFIDAFMADPRYSNTILIVTADHPSFPAPEVLAVEKVVPGQFVDRIPMMIYWRGVKHLKIDVHGRNSLSLAPTIMELAQVRFARNYFLGCSVFSEGCSEASFLTSVDEHIFDTRNGNIRYLTALKPGEAYVQPKAVIDRFVSYSGL